MEKPELPPLKVCVEGEFFTFDDSPDGWEQYENYKRIRRNRIILIGTVVLIILGVLCLAL